MITLTQSWLSPSYKILKKKVKLQQSDFKF